MTVSLQDPAAFTVKATGSKPFSYQWRLNNSPISGATNATLSIDSVSTSDTGIYNVIVSNSAGSAQSSNAMLTAVFTPPAQPAYEPIGPPRRRSGLAFSEIMYHPRDRTDGRNLEFIELYNSNPWPENLGGWQLAGNVSFTFPQGTSIAGQSYLVIAPAPADVQAVYGLSNVLGGFTNSLQQYVVSVPARATYCWQIVWKALGNLITKAVTAPFRLLAGALGVKGQDLDTIAFAPGAAQLPPPEREKLATVVKILADRPKLALEIQGGYSLAEDGAALRTLAVNRALLQKQGIKLAPGEAPGPVSLTNGDTQKAVEALFGERLGAEALAREQQAVKAMPAGQRQAALVERLYDQLREKEPLTATVLPQLARDRAQAIVAQLEQRCPPAG